MVMGAEAQSDTGCSQDAEATVKHSTLPGSLLSPEVDNSEVHKAPETDQIHYPPLYQRKKLKMSSQAIRQSINQSINQQKKLKKKIPRLAKLPRRVLDQLKHLEGIVSTLLSACRLCSVLQVSSFVSCH